jgi:hypothetical protein
VSFNAPRYTVLGFWNHNPKKMNKEFVEERKEWGRVIKGGKGKRELTHS